MTFSRRAALTVGAAALAAPAMPLPTAQAAAPKAGKQVPGFYRFMVGEFEVTALHDGQVNREITTQLFPNTPLEEVVKVMDAQFMPTKPANSVFNTMIVNTGSKLVLIDSGFADNGAATTGQMAANMAAAGINPSQIDIVLVSHFHGDHINGLRNKAGQLLYPNAEIVVPPGDVSYYLDEARMNAAPEAARGGFMIARRVFSPILKDVKQGEWSKEWAPGITAIRSDGHTPGIRPSWSRPVERRCSSSATPATIRGSSPATPIGTSASTSTGRRPSRRASGSSTWRRPTGCRCPSTTRPSRRRALSPRTATVTTGTRSRSRRSSEARASGREETYAPRLAMPTAATISIAKASATATEAEIPSRPSTDRATA